MTIYQTQEDNIRQELANTFPDCEVHRVKRPGNSPLRMVKLTLENEEDAEPALADGVCIGNLWIRPESETNAPKVIRCYGCVKCGHIELSCNYKNDVCSICSESHNYTSCPKKEEKREKLLWQTFSGLKILAIEAANLKNFAFEKTYLYLTGSQRLNKTVNND